MVVSTSWEAITAARAGRSRHRRRFIDPAGNVHGLENDRINNITNFGFAAAPNNQDNIDVLCGVEIDRLRDDDHIDRVVHQTIIKIVPAIVEVYLAWIKP